ncbi:LysE family transporter [Halomonas sp. PAMB 3264]|uniref:LysE family translocator n=1 Tax=unclassified Halomonas TaxID=2609666 RepID=UPI00289ED901|nr:MULTISPECIES: LysE family transporter [unclassified Halomonas]WNL40008.1 LysE family transporter [Halomonas sp. PAMB 3232]WNL43316.1 LysE family transporter [Halomonas sp. PAMB 3264]
MLGIILFGVGIMYTPGPVNLLGLNVGINGQASRSIGFCLGVGSAMLLYLLVLGFAGAAWIGGQALVILSAVGCGYILYLAWKIARASARLKTADAPMRVFGFRDGVAMQLLNPKTPVAVLPIVTLQFPAAGIDGVSLVVWAVGLALLAAGAPGSYMLLGRLVGQRIQQPRLVKGFNLAMAALLAAVAVSIGIEHVWVPLASAAG